MEKFVLAWRDINNPGRALCVGHSVEEPVAVELVPAAQEEAEGRPYRAVRFNTYAEAFAASVALAGLFAGLEAAVVQESELDAQFAPDLPSPRPLLETGPHPLEAVVAERDQEIGRLTEELLAAQARLATEKRMADEMVYALASQRAEELLARAPAAGGEDAGDAPVAAV